ncbi:MULTISPECIES: chorismate mutase [Nocardiopsis]|uniref:chorismate mutase n=1 Tax=Nocardiopsis dassonvillei (strain ATCC 23218 / DSM 43111 / CIP 107115 / JCM 7437 / KCTC 9190 / NBRC 14626 / NCTC 10488 / NRRL B-5397 / IMRU 509) TaxID=446468 RepID=D7B205_NOCDD|nr:MULTISPECIES: chorismate mutase [Nocardiopsis]ADH66626.1 chorismate mutase [Nocardiopsis dassonvillei subsp. dassonvillei DSM 43111]NKY78953.1 chorismate mutase [Nocardiopsis dassonvillei]VEI92648.1 Chorismate mutase AroH [Nocardiopsis dassonvillei]
MNPVLRAVRGGTGVAGDTREAIAAATLAMVRGVLDRNGLSPADVACLWFTVTPDLTADVPPLVLREHRLLDDVPALCAAEPVWDGAPRRTVRVMALARVEPGHEVRHVYLDGATRDRP